MQDVKEAGKERNLKSIKSSVHVCSWVSNLFIFLVVPRLIFENWTARDFMTLVTSEKEYTALADELITICKKYKFDGYVLELWSQFVGRVHNELLVNLVQEIGWFSLTSFKI